MVDAIAKCSLDILQLNIVSQETCIMGPQTCARFKDNEWSMCVHCCSNKDGTSFWPCGFTWEVYVHNTESVCLLMQYRKRSGGVMAEKWRAVTPV